MEYHGVVTELVLDEELARMYAGALYSITRGDGTVDRDEGDVLASLIRRRWELVLDPETLFFTTVTPESFAQAIHDGTPFRSTRHLPEQIGRALIGDAVTLSAWSGGLDDNKVHAILRFARALGMRTDQICAASDQLAVYLE